MTRVLIVEDEAIVAADLANKLRQLGYEVTDIAVRGEDAVAFARERRPDVVLMDIRLAGGMDGVEAAEQIRRQCSVPVIYLTAHSDHATLQRAKLTQPFGYILKPFEERELETHIEMALYKHEAEQKLRASEEHLRQLNAKLEQRVLERTAALQSTVQSLEQLLSTIAHDLRAPNRAMQGLASLLVEDYSHQLDETARGYLQRIAEAAVRNDRMIRELLEYGRLAHVELPRETIDGATLLQEVLTAMQPQLQETGAAVHVASPWPRLVANRLALEQVITNLISNALKFVAPDRHPQLTFAAECPDNAVRLKIRDNGIGIRPEDYERIFAPFQRLHPPDRYSGTGIGLAIVRKAVERMHGRITVSSEPGRGSEFTVELPAA